MPKVIENNNSKRVRNRRKGKFVCRGTITKDGKAIGTATDGTVIFEPKLKPKMFSKNVLRKAVKKVKSKRHHGHAIHA